MDESIWIPPFEGGCGVVDGLDVERYHAQLEVSKSGLDDIDLSPAHFFALHRAPNRPERKTLAGQLEGNLAHCAILEPDVFGDRYLIGPDWNRNTNKWKEFLESVEPGVVVIKPEQYETAMCQAESVRALPEVREALESGFAERSAFWVDPDTGVRCRCRPDWTHSAGESSVILLDVKTYSIASPDEFRRQAARKRYHVQDAFYSDGYAVAADVDVLAFVFVAVETDYPFAANAMMLDGASRDQGRADYKRNLRTYARCQETNEWPGYSKEIQMITLPAWAFQE